MNSMIIEKLLAASVIDSEGKVNLSTLAQYTLSHDILVVMHDITVTDNGVSVTAPYLRAVVDKWTFQDKAMGEQFITFDYLSENPVSWAIGDYCIFRGETYSLNYIPSVTQRAGYGKSLDSFKYEGVKMDSFADELTRCEMLDVILTTGQQDPDEGANHTGSSVFQLFCGETTVEVTTVQDNEEVTTTVVRTPVSVLADRIQANLNRMYTGSKAWTVLVNQSTTHTEDKMLSFDSQKVAQALAEVKNVFDLNYSIQGRTIKIGYELGDVADVDYGYGRGYPTAQSGGKGLFEIKKISDSSQQIVTRLRVLGSDKNLPYRYYNKAYGLPQALFPTRLQLPDTFLPEGSPSDPAGTASKWGHNKQRPSTLRAVKGPSNDSYIDRDDDAANSVEGIREASIRFDGSQSKLKEIYPSIENTTFAELRGEHVPDQEGNTGNDAYPGYGGSELINRILAVGYQYGGVMHDDANVGDGIPTEDGTTQQQPGTDVYVELHDEQLDLIDGLYYGEEVTLFTVSGQSQGRYFFTPVSGKAPYFVYNTGVSDTPVGFIIKVKQTLESSGVTTTIAEYRSDLVTGLNAIALPSIPDAFYMDDAKVREILVSGMSDITVTFTPYSSMAPYMSYRVGLRQGETSVGQYVWSSVEDMDSSNMPFHIFVKDMGFDFTAQFNGDTPKIVMKSGMCVGREFQIGENIEKVMYNGKHGYMLTLVRDSDSSLNTYFPSAKYQIAADDYFVITGIDLPDAYIKAAELRLLTAATEWLAENGSTHFKYQPSIDDIYLKYNYDNMVAAGTVEDSVFWKLYAGYSLPFIPISDTPGSEDPLSVMIESVTITMGESLTRKVDITLNDELKESTLKRVTRDVDSLSHEVQSLGSGMSSIAVENALKTIGDRRYLSKTDDDTAAGNILFEGSIRFDRNVSFAKKADGSYAAYVDSAGNIHSDKNITADGGVAAGGMVSLSPISGGGGGDTAAVQFDENTEYSEDTPYLPDPNGLLKLPAYPDTPQVVGYNSLDETEAENLGKVASAKAVAVNKANIDIESFPTYDPDEDYNRGQHVKVLDEVTGVYVGYRFNLNHPHTVEGLIGYVERVGYKTLAEPLSITTSDLDRILN